jgi:hypothetical protein
MLVDPCVVPSSAQFNADPAVYQIVNRSRKPQEYVNGYDIIIAMRKWRLERGYFLYQSDSWKYLWTYCLYEDPGTVPCN